MKISPFYQNILYTTNNVLIILCEKIFAPFFRNHGFLLQNGNDRKPRVSCSLGGTIINLHRSEKPSEGEFREKSK